MNMDMLTRDQSIQQTVFRTCVNDTHCSLIIEMMYEIGNDFREARHSIISGLANEGITLPDAGIKIR
jgi:hypothetical protein